MRPGEGIVIVSSGATVTYGVANSRGRAPVVRIRLQDGEQISDDEWPDVRRAIMGSIDRVTGIIHSSSDKGEYIAIELSVTPARHHAELLAADCRVICRAANILIANGPGPMST